MSDALSEKSAIIFQEMMSHPALFSHLKPKKIAIVGENCETILLETVKHPTLAEIWRITQEKQSSSDDRVKYCTTKQWLTDANADSFDIILSTETAPAFADYFKQLHSDGILVQLSDSLFQFDTLKTTQKSLLATGFRDVLLMSFPQPNFPTGWRSAFMAKKNGVFKKIREKDIYNKTFTTHYYNFDVHKASLVLPEFMREELTC